MRKALFVDCDDTLYANNFQTAELLTVSIADYCTRHVGVSYEKSVALYKEHGTCLKGLEVEGIPHDRDHFLETVHNVHLAFSRDEPLREMLSQLDHEAHDVRVFTASVSSHALRCLDQLGVRHHLVHDNRPVIDVRSVGFASKHSPEAYASAQAIVQQPNPSLCTLVDDNWSNIRAAKAAGWRTVVCGAVSRYGQPATELLEADHVLASIHELRAVLPEFFTAEAEAVGGSR